MIVDDHVDAAAGLQQFFERHGYQATFFSDGMGALEQVAKNPPDVIILDVSMPTMAGDEVLHALVQRRVPTRVIVLTGIATDVPAIVRFVRGGACDYMIKPCEPAQLLAAVRRAIEMEHTINVRASKPTETMRKLMAEATSLQAKVTALEEQLQNQGRDATLRLQAKDDELSAIKNKQLAFPTLVRVLYVVIVTGAVIALSFIRTFPSTTILVFYVVLLLVLALPLERVQRFMAKGWNAEAELSLDHVENSKQRRTQRLNRPASAETENEHSRNSRLST